MKKMTRIALALSLVLALFLLIVPAVADSAYKVPTANPTFTRGSRQSGTYTSVQTVNSVYMRVREAQRRGVYYLDSTWAGWQSFTEAARSKLVDIRIELVGYQQNTGDSWYVQFYNYNTSAWDSTWYALGSLPTSPSGTLTVAVGDAAKVRTFVSAAGAFRLRFADSNTATGGTDATRTDLYIDMLRAQFLYDITPPVSNITAPASGTQTNAHAYTVTGTSSDPTPDASGVTAVDVSVNGGTSWNAATPGSPGNYSTWSYNWSSIPAEGTYNIRSRATDGAGNVETPGPGVNLIVDWTPPQVASTSPTNGQTNVAVTTNAVRATFTEANAMNASTINTGTFLLNGGAVAGSVSYDVGTKTATFTPASELSYGTSYTATLTTGITDQAGNPLASNYNWTFTTAPVSPAFIYADDAAWVKSGTWALENYTGLEPGGTKILVANDAGATATYTVPPGYTRLRVASSKYWSCGYVDVLLDGTVVADDVDLKGPYGSTTWGNVIYENLAVNPAVSHTLAIRATGTGGPTSVTIGGVTYPVSGLHFVNVQWLKYW
jgi:Bacterial Ig-like domain